MRKQEPTFIYLFYTQDSCCKTDSVRAKEAGDFSEAYKSLLSIKEKEEAVPLCMLIYTFHTPAFIASVYVFVEHGVQWKTSQKHVLCVCVCVCVFTCLFRPMHKGQI